jgi:hypothetical protein
MRTNRLNLFLSLSAAALVAVSCTDLEVTETDSVITPADANGSTFVGVADVDGALNAGYGTINGLYTDQAGYYALQEVTADSYLIPTRGSDWGDNGLWRQLHQHEWNATQAFVGGVWGSVNGLQLIMSEVIDPQSNASSTQKAQAHFIRAWSMLTILDLFGQVPVRDVTLALASFPEVLTGADAVAFIAGDLDAAISGLPAASDFASREKATKEAAQFLKARLMLNKHIYTNAGAADASDMAAVVSLVDAIGGSHSLQAGYFDLFRDTADSETIWWVGASVGNNIWNGMHYNQAPEMAGGGWNGFSTLAEYYDLFEGDAFSNDLDAMGMPVDGQEERRGGVPQAGRLIGDVPGGSDGNGDGYADGSNIGNGFLIGQQYNYDGTPLQQRQGRPLNFTRGFGQFSNLDANGNNTSPELINNPEETGIRVIKYSPVYGAFTPHKIAFRYADAHLMKAEALHRSGNSGQALTLVNELRAIRGAQALGSISDQDLLDERARELYGEFVRRTDMIRFGQYTRGWELKASASVGDTKWNKFPIPLAQLALNPNLTQNPGY